VQESTVAAWYEQVVIIPLFTKPVSKMTYTVSSGTLNSSIPCHTCSRNCLMQPGSEIQPLLIVNVNVNVNLYNALSFRNL